MTHEYSIFDVNYEIDEVQREADLISNLLDLGGGVKVSDDTMIRISAGDLDKIHLRLCDLLVVLRSAPVTLPFPCRNGK